ncbi:MAG: hypothetical protein P8N00_01575 [Flavobacteriales bacterium]|nr:hypothetical protein [Flavobacteriales bacterium]
MGHGMHSDDARRIRLTGNQLKNEFLKKYTTKGLLNKTIDLVQPISFDRERSVLIKAGKNWQFRLGRIPEIEEHVEDYQDEGKIVRFSTTSNIEDVVLTKGFLTKYAFHSDLFIARDRLLWQVFTSSDIVSLILDNCSVRVLNSGRIKFDFHSKEKTTKGIMTIEYRAEEHKKSWVFGAHGGGSGEKLRELMYESLLFTELSL